MFKNINLKFKSKIIISFSVITLLVLFLGINSIIQCNKSNNSLNSLIEQNKIFSENVEYARKAEISFKKQVQEWKNILIRGNDPKSYDKYLGNFKNEEKNVQENLMNLKANLDKLNLSIKELDSLLAIHLDLGQKYIAALVHYDKSNPNSYAIVDKLVTGIDRTPTDMIDTIANQSLLIKSQSLTKYEKQLQEKYSDSVNSNIGIILLCTIFSIFTGIVLTSSVTRPIKNIVEVANKIASGDLDVNMSNINITIQDEIGQLGRALKNMADNLNENISNINSSAQQVTTGANQISLSGQALSQSSTEQASSIQEITSSMSQVSSQTKQNATNANQANDLANKTKNNAVSGNNQMKEMLYAMNEINTSSSSISKIIKVIDEIAFQTNILALNAAVEAARAGQHGKGFAVVAEEVRNLAARSANAAKETTSMIESSIQKVNTGTQIANDTAKALNTIVNDITEASQLVSQIASASNEQASGISQINSAIEQIAKVIQTNSATAEESAAASEELSSQAKILKDIVAKFTLKKNNSSSNFNNISPDVLRTLQTMIQNKQNANYVNQNFAQTNTQLNTKTQINLSDEEFGKY